MIDVQRLRVLRSVAEHGSFNRAATALHLTPSAVSQHIAALERSLGAPVVDRSTRGVTLTQAGRIMVGAAESVAAELAHAAREIDRLGTARGQLTIATFTSGGQHLLPDALTHLTAAHPGTVVHVRQAEPEDSLPLLRQGAVDVALAYHFDGPLPRLRGPGPAVQWIPLMEDPLHVVLPETHPLAARPVLDLAELADEPWVLGCLKTEAYLRRYAEHAGFSPDVRGSTTDYFFARSLVAAGVGLSLIPTVALTPALPGVRAVPLDTPTPARHIGAAVLRRPGRPEVSTLIEGLRQNTAGESSVGSVAVNAPARQASSTDLRRPTRDLLGSH